MSDEALNLLRRMMIDQALESRDREAFFRLTGPNWQAYVLGAGTDSEDGKDLLSFLTEDPHFWDLRLYETMALRPYVNYRFRDVICDVLYVGEIRIPVGWPGAIEARFRPRPSSGPTIAQPDWF
ncbi:MAG: IDEAL domain-containing protein [Alicyclobacillus sp.]|nr:IDEAL domain-containing protein [Alicyclobacillus sp.]